MMGYNVNISVENIWNYSKKFLTGFTVSNTVRHRDANEYSTTSTSYIRIKKYLISGCGRIRIKYKLRTSNSNSICYVAIYKNGSIEDEKHTPGITYSEESVDIDVNNSDVIEIKLRGTNSSYDVYISDIRICYDLVNGGVTEVD